MELNIFEYASLQKSEPTIFFLREKMWKKCDIGHMKEGHSVTISEEASSVPIKEAILLL